MPRTIDEIRTIDDVFDLWKSIAEMARDVNRKYQTVSKWEQRGRIPPEAFDSVIVAAARKEQPLTHGMLIALNGKRRPPEPTAASVLTGTNS